MEKTVIALVEISGCLAFQRMFIEIVDTGSEDGNVAAAEERYATIFGGPFESYHCDQCGDYTSMSVTQLSEKQRRRVLFRERTGDLVAQDQPLHRLPRA